VQGDAVKQILNAMIDALEKNIIECKKLVFIKAEPYKIRELQFQDENGKFSKTLAKTFTKTLKNMVDECVAIWVKEYGEVQNETDIKDIFGLMVDTLYEKVQ
jgi:hypothetical protein